MQGDGSQGWSPLGHTRGEQPYYYDLYTHDGIGGYGPPAPAAPPPPPGGRRGWVVALVVVLALAVVGGLVTVAVVAARGQAEPAPTAAPAPTPSPVAPSSSAAATTTTAAACPTPATLAGTGAELTAQGLSLSFAVAAGCSGGQTLATAVELRVADGAAQVAAGSLDLAATPLVLAPGRPGSLTVVFPAGAYWVVPSAASATSLAATLAPGAPGEVRAPTDRVSTTVSAPLAPTGDPQAAAAAALTRQADLDRPQVAAALAEQWQPQLSAKKAGLEADGRVYDDVGVLADHLALRARYPQARLVFSGEWTSYQGRDFWVTLAGVVEPDADAALGWCAAEGFDPTQCLAVLLSATRGPEGTSRTR